MLASQIPQKFPIPFAKNAGSGYIRPVPQASQIGITNGAASLNDGFPPVCFQPVGAGGTPPSGQDFNGILNEVTAWNQWQSAGGPVYYDSTFSANIGGYPKGAVLSSLNTNGNFWLSTVDNNTSNPDTGGANWVGFSTATPPSLVHFGQDTGSTNAYVISAASLSPPITSYQDGMVVIMAVANSSTGASTINISSIGLVSMKRADGTPIRANDLQAGSRVQLIYNATTGVFAVAGLYSSFLPSSGIFPFTSSTTFTVPAGVYLIKRGRVWGGGGGGGGSASAAATGAGGGGYAEDAGLAVTPGQTLTITVGAAGGGGSTSGTDGAAGGTTSVAITGNPAWISATGGAGGWGTNNLSGKTGGGVGGTGSGSSGNALTATGGAGSLGLAYGSTPGSGIGGAGAFGGASPTPNEAVGGSPGNFPGGGGNGGVGTFVGGPGGGGLVIIEY